MENRDEQLPLLFVDDDLGMSRMLKASLVGLGHHLNSAQKRSKGRKSGHRLPVETEDIDLPNLS